MAQCSMCGNEYEPSLTITFLGTTQTFDCFECAIHMLAPVCEHCGCRIIGHGVQAGAKMYCCAHCSRMAGVEGIESSVEANGTGDTIILLGGTS